jgi:hypothetical protein
LIFAARAALMTAIGFIGFVVADPAGHPIVQHWAWDPAVDLAAFYGLTLLTFTAFPKSRRTDLAQAMIALGVMLAVTRQAADGSRHLYAAALAVVGVLAAHLPTHMEAVRKAMREIPSATPALARGIKDRRRSALGLDIAAEPASSSDPRLISRSPSPRGVILLGAWGLAAGIVFATLCPQAWRPHLGDAQTERFYAYFAAAWTFALAYPKRPWTVALTAVLFAVLLELAQFAAPGRDPGLPDAVAKALGGLGGVSAAVFCTFLGRSVMTLLTAPEGRASAKPTAGRPMVVTGAAR